VRSSSDETCTNEMDARPDTENQYADSENQHVDSENQLYVNAVAPAEARDEHGVDGDKSQALYQDLNLGAGSAEPIVYEIIKPSVQPKPRHT